jgi:RNA polymerase sigma factor (sigma-70 family)
MWSTESSAADWYARRVDDVDLLERWRAGDRASGEELFARHFDSLCAFFVTKCAEPDELVQRTLVACLKAKEQFRSQSSFRTYLFTIARHELYHHFRRGRQDRERLDFAVTSVAELVTTPGTKLARHAEQQQMLQVLRTMPVDHQMLLELFYWHDVEVQALAEIFEATPNAIRVRLHRARQQLRDGLVALGDQESTTWLDRSSRRIQ